MGRNQRGITFIGFIVVATLAVLIGLAAIRLVPIYGEQMKVSRLLKDVKDELDGQDPTPQRIRNSIDKRLDIEMISSLHSRDFEVRKTDGGLVVSVHYEDRAPYIGNVSLLAEFNDSVEIRR